MRSVRSGLESACPDVRTASQAKRKAIDPDAPYDEEKITVNDFIRRANAATKRLDMERAAATKAATAKDAEAAARTAKAAAKATKAAEANGGAEGAGSGKPVAARVPPADAEGAGAGDADSGEEAAPSGRAASGGKAIAVAPAVAAAEGGSGMPQLVIRNGQIVVDPTSLRVQVRTRSIFSASCAHC